jgi:hypothetical protein
LAPVELILLGVIAIIFTIVFFFLYVELSTRKRRLVQEIKITLEDLPDKLSERKAKDGTSLGDDAAQEKDKLDKKIKEKIGMLDDLSIGELETIRATVKKNYRELPKLNVDNKSVFSRANSMLDHFIPKKGS